MDKTHWLAILCVAGLLTSAIAGERPYIGYAYPAGGQQGTTFQVKLGGQGLEEVNQAIVSGTGVQAKVLEYYRRLGPQEISLLNDQLRELNKAKPATVAAKAIEVRFAPAAIASKPPPPMPALPQGYEPAQIATRIERRLAEAVNTPASNSISNLVFVEIIIAADAIPGPRELRLVTPRGGVSNPLVFHVGQLPEFVRKPMLSASLQVLGKEESALRKRPPEEVEQRLTIPCTANGQVASGEINRYRFEARKGQRLVLTTEARSLIPYLADAVPGWFQPVLAIYDAAGKEVAYDDDYRFKPDPVILFEVPKSGEYVFTITDAIYRGREDFIYRVTVGEVPFVTSIFPLGIESEDSEASNGIDHIGPRSSGATVSSGPAIDVKGWNLQKATLPPPKDAPPGIYHLTAHGSGSLISNLVPFAVDDLPECNEIEPNNDHATAQRVVLPIIVNGRIDKPGDWDVFKFAGKAGQTIVAEVYARRLDSPLDSMLKLVDSAGKLLAFNDDHEDAGSGLNTHHADSYIRIKLPANGTYFLHLGDAAKAGGEEYGYRLRISEPRPDFELRLLPSSLALRAQSTGGVDVKVLRKDGFDAPLKLVLKDPPEGFSALPVTLGPGQDTVRFNLKTTLTTTPVPVTLHVVGSATVADRELSHEAVPAEDRMQAFLWRQLVPALEFKVMVFDPSAEPPPKRVSHVKLPTHVADPSVTAAGKPKFTKQQVIGRLKQLKYLFEEGLLTEEFYARKVAECEAVQ